MTLPLSTRLLLRAVTELEERGHRDAARAGHRRLWASLPPGEARVDVAAALVRLGLHARSPEALEEGCAAWRSLGAQTGELKRSRATALGLVRAALDDRRAPEAATISGAEVERAPDHALARYARGRLAVLEGDATAGEALLARAAAGADPRTAERAVAALATLPDQRLPRPGEALPEGVSIAARLGLARRLARSAGRYARVRGLDLLLGALPTDSPEEGACMEVLAVAAVHVDVVGARITEIERDRLRELLGRMPASLAAPVARVSEALELRARLAPLAPAPRVALLSTEGPPVTQPLARAAQRATGPWPESSSPHEALAGEALRVIDALRSGAPASFDRLVSLFDAAGPGAALVPTLWALFPPFVQRHAALGLSRDRLRPLLAAVLDGGPIRSLDPAVLSRALEALGEDDLAERAARRAADEGDGAAYADRLVRRAFRLAASQPTESLRLLERADRIG